MFTGNGWSDYQHWISTDTVIVAKLNRLIEECRRAPFTGLGKPEPLKGDLAGWWSRRIASDHRLVYRVTGKTDQDRRLEIASCRYHYGS